MKPEQWQNINSLFTAALKREPGERATFLKDACAGNEALRKEVEGLLSAHDEAGSFMETPPVGFAAEMFRGNQPPPLVGQTFGSYEVVNIIGAGGMGEVYLARDKRLDRKVALKVLPAHFTQEAERVRRFQQEARAASAL